MAGPSQIDLQIAIEILDKATQEMGKIRSAIEEHVKGIGNAFHGLAGDLAVFDLAVAGIERLLSPLQSLLGEMEQWQQVQLQVAATLRSTGDASGATAAQIRQLAQAYSDVTRFSRTAIEAGDAILLTYPNIGGKLFPQATQAALDFATAMGKSLPQAFNAVGRAMNDPLQGMLLLSRAGVQFTEAEKKTMEALVRSGQAMKAQQMILDLLEKKYGGSAAEAVKGFAGQIDQLRNRMTRDLVDFMNANVMPTLNRFGDWLNNTGYPAIKRFADTEIVPRIREFAGFVQSSVLPVLLSFWDWIQNRLAPALRTFWDDQLHPKITAFWNLLQNQVLPVVKDVASAIGDKLAPVVKDIIGWFGDHQDVLATFATALGTVMAAAAALAVVLAIVVPLVSALTDPITLTIVALALLGTGISELVQHWDDFTGELGKAAAAVGAFANTIPGITEAWNAIKSAIQQFKDWISGTLIPGLQGDWDTLKYDLDLLHDKFTIIWNAIKLVVELSVLPIVETVKIAWAELTSFTQVYFTLIHDVIVLVMHGIQTVIDFVLALIQGNWNEAWFQIEVFVGHIIQDILRIIGDGLGMVPHIAAAVWTAVGDDAGHIWNAIVTTVETAVNAIIDLINGMTAKISAGLQALSSITIDIPEVDTHIPGVGTIGGGSIHPFSAAGLVSIPPIEHVSGGTIAFAGGGGGSGGQSYVGNGGMTPEQAIAAATPGDTNTGGYSPAQLQGLTGGGAGGYPGGGGGGGGGGGPDNTPMPDMSGDGNGAGDFNQGSPKGGGGGKPKKGKGAGGGSPLSPGQLADDAQRAADELVLAKEKLDELLAPTNDEVKRVLPQTLLDDAAKLQQAISGGGDTPGLQQAFDDLSTAVAKYQSDIANNPGDKKLIEDDKAMVASKQGAWNTVSKLVGDARKQLQTDQTTYNTQQQADAEALKTASADLATAQVQSNQLASGTITEKHREVTAAMVADEATTTQAARVAAQGKQDAYTTALNKLIDDINNQVSPTQIKADQVAVASAKDAANETYNAWHAADTALEADRKTAITEADKLASAIVAALKEQAKQEEKTAEDGLQAQKKAATEASALKIQQWQEETQRFKDNLDLQTKAADEAASKQEQAALAAIDSGAAAAAKALQDQIDAPAKADRLDKEKDLEEKIAAAAGDKQKELQDQLKQMKDEDHKADLERQISAIKEKATKDKDAIKQKDADEKKARDDAASAAKKAADETLKTESDNEKNTTRALVDQLDLRIAAVKQHYTDITTEDALNKKTLLLMEGGHQDQLVALLKSYNPQWKQVGQSLGEQLINGIQDSGLENSITTILSLITQAQHVANGTATPGGAASAVAVTTAGSNRGSLHAMADAALAAAGGGNTTVAPGAVVVNVNVPNTNASPEDIASVVETAVGNALGNAVGRDAQLAGAR